MPSSACCARSLRWPSSASCATAPASASSTPSAQTETWRGRATIGDPSAPGIRMSTIPTLETASKGSIYLIGGEKGGVGKSFVARLLAQHFIDQQIPFVGFDTDRSHATLTRFYTGFASPIVVDRYEALDAIIESAVEVPARRVLVDLAAQTMEPMARWMEESGVLDLADMQGIALNYWHVMDNGRDSMELLLKL